MDWIYPVKTYRLENGTYVGTQAEIPKGETFETVEVPTNPKEDLLKFLNELVLSQPVTPIQADDTPPAATSTVPQSTEEERVYAQFRANVAAGRVDLDETILAAPLDVSLRLLGLVSERIREHYAKGKRNENRSEPVRREREHGETLG